MKILAHLNKKYHRSHETVFVQHHENHLLIFWAEYFLLDLSNLF